MRYMFILLYVFATFSAKAETFPDYSTWELESEPEVLGDILRKSVYKNGALKVTEAADLNGTIIFICLERNLLPKRCLFRVAAGLLIKGTYRYEKPADPGRLTLEKVRYGWERRGLICTSIVAGAGSHDVQTVVVCE